jgi:ribonuclease P protein component
MEVSYYEDDISASEEEAGKVTRFHEEDVDTGWPQRDQAADRQGKKEAHCIGPDRGPIVFMRRSLPGSKRLKKPGQFKAVYRLGKSCANRLVVLYTNPVADTETKAGFVVGKAMGGAVKRNRARRLMKEAYRLHSDQVKPGFQLVFIGRTSLKGARLAQVEPALLDVLKKGGVLLC